MAENFGKILYLNTAVGEYITRRTVKPSEASVEVSRSGAIVNRPQEYAVAVFRTVVPYQTPTWIPELDLSAADGLTTPYSISLRADVSGTVYRGRAFLQLIKRPSEVKIYTGQQPHDGYTYVWDINEVVQILNDAMQRAYDALLAAGAPLDPAEAPFFSWVQGSVDRIRVSAYPYSLWETKDIGSTADRAEIFFNEPGEFLVSGWPYRTMRNDHQVPDPNGEDNLLLLWGNGDNFLPGTGGSGNAQTGIEPATPSQASIFLEQSEASPLPTIDRVILTTSLPIIPEATGSAGAGRDQVLTDFAPDPTVRGKHLQIFNASFGDARWHSLSGTGAISTFRLSFQLRQWNDIVVNDKIYWKGGAPSVKLCFAPLKYLEGGSA